MPEATKVIPKNGINNIFPPKILIEAIKPPIASEPASPINTLALKVLNVRKPIIAPASVTLKRARFSYSPTFT